MARIFLAFPPDAVARLGDEGEPLHGMGWKSRVSEYEAGTPSHWTHYLAYDPFGRPATIRPPDGAAHDVTLTYAGVGVVKRKVKVATARQGEGRVSSAVANGVPLLYLHLAAPSMDHAVREAIAGTRELGFCVQRIELDPDVFLAEAA